MDKKNKNREIITSHHFNLHFENYFYHIFIEK